MLVLHEIVFSSISTSPAWWTPASGSDNTPTVVWNFREDSTIKPAVSDLLGIRSTHNRLHKLTPSVFYHPGPLNTMAGDASRCFDLSTNPFLELFCSKYSPQSPGSWTMYHLPTEALYLVISALCKYPYAAETSPTAGPPPYTPSRPPSALTCSSTTCLTT